ncbi:MAG: NAD-dependent epimerase/dehydratase family protein [Phycisphaerales bacterium]|nr:NAD-dependent epimerase/dehydratase family protein [Phycisphaerales bacterium]
MNNCINDNSNLIDRRVLVTGAGGFLGSHVVDLLQQQGVKKVHGVMRSQCDLRDTSAVQELFEAFDPEVVIHIAAAQGGVAWQQANQCTAFLDNAAMMEALVATSIETNVSRFVFTASSICYPAKANIPYQEAALWDGPPEPAHWGYAHAKRGGIALLQSAHQQHGLGASVVMPANMYGPRARFEPDRSNVVAATIRRCVEARDQGQDSITCWGSGQAIREFLYVMDAAEGVIRAACRLEEPQPVNLGTGVETTISQLVESVAEVVGFKGQILWDTDRPEGAPRVCMDITQLQEQLDWSPPTSLIEGLRATVDWFESSKG